MTRFDEVPIAALPQSFFDTVSRRLQNFTVGLYRFEGSGTEENISLLGSCTLVKAGRVHAILTAHHVVEVLPERGKLGLVLTSVAHRRAVDTSALTYLKIARGVIDADGPDLGAIVLAPPVAGTIGAEKSFFDLDQLRARMLTNPPDRNCGVWFVHGFVAEKTVDEPGRDGYGRIKCFCNFSGVGGPDEPPLLSGRYDYYRFPIVQACRADAPGFFGGISGGGLWQVPIRRADDGSHLPLRPLYTGLAFYQEPDSDTGCALRCHGRASVYTVAYDAMFSFQQ